MKIIPRGNFQGTDAEFLQFIEARIEAFRLALREHATTVGVPAPREDDLIEDIVRFNEAYEIELEPKKLTPEELAAIEAAKLRESMFKSEVLAKELLEKLTTATPEQLNDYVNNSVTDLASARTMFKRVLLILALVAR